MVYNNLPLTLGDVMHVSSPWKFHQYVWPLNHRTVEQSSLGVGDC